MALGGVVLLAGSVSLASLDVSEAGGVFGPSAFAGVLFVTVFAAVLGFGCFVFGALAFALAFGALVGVPMRKPTPGRSPVSFFFFLLFVFAGRLVGADFFLLSAAEIASGVPAKKSRKEQKEAIPSDWKCF